MRRKKKLALKVHSATLAQGVLFLEKAEDDPDIRNLLPFSKTGSKRSETVQIIGPNAPERGETSFTFNRRYLNCWQSEPSSWVRDFCREHTLLAGDRLDLQLISENAFLLKHAGRPRRRKLHFIDLFAGIGGMHYAFEKAGASCIFSCESDDFCQISYLVNHGDVPASDITEFSPDVIPRHDILVAGFPCQPFSLAGVSKKNSLGRPHGFLDETQGTLFYNIVEILRAKQPQAFLLENVKNLKSHDDGKTFTTIMNALRELGYYLSEHSTIKIIDAIDVVPQHRERIFIVGTKIGDAGFEFSMPTTEEIQKEHDGPKTTLGEILEDNPDPSFTLQDGTWRSLQNHKEKHEKAGHGFGYSMVTPDQTTRTLSARYHKDGGEILIDQGNKNPRKLTPRECARLMGFSEDYRIEVSDTQAYRQFGNAVVVPVAQAIARKLVEAVLNPKIVIRTADGYFPGQERNLAFGPEEEVA